jgi:hypothetical protein
MNEIVVNVLQPTSMYYNPLMGLLSVIKIDDFLIEIILTYFLLHSFSVIL